MIFRTRASRSLLIHERHKSERSKKRMRERGCSPQGCECRRVRQDRPPFRTGSVATRRAQVASSSALSPSQLGEQTRVGWPESARE